MGRSSEQNLYESLIIEVIAIYGFSLFYIPRKSFNRDLILNEDTLNTYEHAFPLEMYFKNVTGFAGEGDLLTKFGVEIRDSATLIVARSRWEKEVARSGLAQLTTRPAEGDIVFFPLTNSIFEIRKVEDREPFFQIGKLYVYELQVELIQYSSERVTTGVDAIDAVVSNQSLDIQNFELTLENGFRLLLEQETNSSVILESFDTSLIDPLAQNEKFEAEIDVLDFSERNPFGEVYNT
jgi:hypothetical protein